MLFVQDLHTINAAIGMNCAIILSLVEVKRMFTFFIRSQSNKLQKTGFVVLFVFLFLGETWVSRFMLFVIHACGVWIQCLQCNESQSCPTPQYPLWSIWQRLYSCFVKVERIMFIRCIASFSFQECSPYASLYMMSLST